MGVLWSPFKYLSSPRPSVKSAVRWKFYEQHHNRCRCTTNELIIIITGAALSSRAAGICFLWIKCWQVTATSNLTIYCAPNFHSDHGFESIAPKTGMFSRGISSKKINAVIRHQEKIADTVERLTRCVPDYYK